MLAHQDTPEDVRARARICEGNPDKCCGQISRGSDPCRGCKIKTYLNFAPKLQTTEYVFYLDWYVRTFAVPPEEVAWRDSLLMMIFGGAQAEHERAKWAKDGKDRP